MNEKPNIQAKNEDALTQNVMAVVGVSNILGQTLGPQGKDVMVINQVGASITSNDGATILTNLAVNHPIVEALITSANILAERVGDATTTMTVIAGNLCENGLYLTLKEDVDVVTITKGYNLALNKTLELLDKYSLDVDVKDKSLLKQFVNTTLTGKNTEGLETIYNICIDAVTTTDGNLELIKKYKLKGTLENCKLVKGIVLDLSVDNTQMEKQILSPKILILDEAIELKNPALDMKIDITNKEEYIKLVTMEKDLTIKMAEKVKNLGANVIICRQNITDFALDYFLRNNIIAIRNVEKEDSEFVSKATGAMIAKNLDTAKPEDLGIADSINIERLTDENYVVINKEDSKVTTILIGGTNRLALDEYERGIDDALGVIKTILKHKKYVYGAGSIEVKIAYDLKEYAKTIENGKLQASIEQYANALEEIPKILAKSSGQNKLTALGKLRVNREKHYGIDVEHSDVKPMLEVIEPTEVKRQAYTIATEFTNNVLRVGYILSGRMSK